MSQISKVVFITYQPYNYKVTAATNRLESIIQGLLKNGVNVTVFGTLPSKVDSHISGSFSYYNLSFIKNKYNKLINIIALLISFPFVAIKLMKIDRDTVVITYQNSFWIFDIFYLMICKFRKIKIVRGVYRGNWVYALTPFLYFLYVNLLVRFYDSFYVISTTLYKEVSNKFKKPVVIINMTVDLGRFTRITNAKVDSVRIKYIGYCGSINQEKDGVLSLVEAFIEISKIHPNINLKLVGNGTKEFRERIVSTLELNNLSERFELIEYLDGNQVVEFLKNASLLVLARPNSSQALNGFPTKVGEYLASQTPCVLTKTGDIDKIIQDNIHAKLIAPDNLQELITSIDWCLSNYDLARKFGLEGYNLAEKSFNSTIESKKLADFIFK